ncbi:hypothetical protein F4778DRAFT_633759 [Xylariomycetidae sp. FL2044]|nr:hypothetical protein F4778DRAFT_633759 [Xylariomycetidae sp. FL2044]
MSSRPNPNPNPSANVSSSSSSLGLPCDRAICCLTFSPAANATFRPGDSILVSWYAGRDPAQGQETRYSVYLTPAALGDGGTNTTVLNNGTFQHPNNWTTIDECGNTQASISWTLPPDFSVTTAHPYYRMIFVNTTTTTTAATEGEEEEEDQDQGASDTLEWSSGVFRIVEAVGGIGSSSSTTTTNGSTTTLSTTTTITSGTGTGTSSEGSTATIATSAQSTTTMSPPSSRGSQRSRSSSGLGLGLGFVIGVLGLPLLLRIL